MKKDVTAALAFLFIVILSSLVSAEFRKVMVVELDYSKGNVTLTNLSTKSGFFFEEKNQPPEGYNSVIRNKNGEITFQEKFLFPLAPEGIPIPLDRGKRRLFLPYTENTERLEVYSPDGEKILEKDLTKFINMLVQKREDNNAPNYFFYYILILLALIIIISIIILVVKKRKKDYSSSRKGHLRGTN